MTDVPEMVERVARAICVVRGEDPDEDWRCHNGIMLDVAVENPERWAHHQNLKQARAAIEAMREPTVEMVREGNRIGGTAESEPDDFYEAWKVMIDKALGK